VLAEVSERAWIKDNNSFMYLSSMVLSYTYTYILGHAKESTVLPALAPMGVTTLESAARRDGFFIYECPITSLNERGEHLVSLMSTSQRSGRSVIRETKGHRNLPTSQDKHRIDSP
jgi:hypothetical protein